MRLFIIGLFAMVASGSPADAKALRPSQLKCVEELTGYKAKDGKKEYSVKKAEKVCSKDYTAPFLSCVAGTRRQLQTLDNSINFCKKNPENSKQMCVQSLASYRGKKDKQEISPNKLAEICKKSNTQKVVECVGSSQRTLGSAVAAVKFCEKKPSQQQVACVKELGAMKNKKGKELVKGNDIGKVCMKNSSVAFLDCVSRSRDTKACQSGPGGSKRLPASVGKR